MARRCQDTGDVLLVTLKAVHHLGEDQVEAPDQVLVRHARRGRGSRKLRLRYSLRRQIAIHEAGHAVALRALALGTQGEMTIDAVDGGVTRSEMDARTIQSEERLMDLIAVKLAGRAAEIACGLAPFAGSGLGDGTDLQVATALALELECRAGFAIDAPLLHVEPGKGNALHLARPDAYRKANARLERAHAMAQQIIQRHRDAHGALVDALIMHGTLDGDEVDAILEPRMTRTE